MFHLNRWARDRDELRAAYEWEREVASLQALLTRDELAPSNPLSASSSLNRPQEHHRGSDL